MEVSNKALSLFLIVAIVISFGGALYSLHEMEQLRIGSITAYATSDTGNVTVNISQSLSLSIVDKTIQFGDCQTIGGETYNVHSFNDTRHTDSGGSPSNCSFGGGTATGNDSILIKNIGNIDINLTMVTSTVGSNFTTTGNHTQGSFLPSSNTNGSMIAYAVANGTISGQDDPGCMNNITLVNMVGYPDGADRGAIGINLMTVPEAVDLSTEANMDLYFMNLTNSTVRYPVCSNLTQSPNSVVTVYARIWIPFDATPGSSTVDWTFYGQDATVD